MIHNRWRASYRVAMAGSALLLCSCTHKPEPATRPLNQATPQLHPRTGPLDAGEGGPGIGGGPGVGRSGKGPGPGSTTRPGGSDAGPGDQPGASGPPGKSPTTSRSVPFGDGGGGTGGVKPPGQKSDPSPKSGANNSGGSSAGTGHKDPLGDPTRRLTGAEQELKVQAKPSGKGSDSKPEKDADAKPVVQQEPAARTSNAPVDFKPVDASTADVERLPPEKRAAVLRYLKAVQQRQATTQSSEEK